MVTTRTDTKLADPLSIATRGVLTNDELGFATLGRIHEVEVLVFDDEPAYIVRYGSPAPQSAERSHRQVAELDVKFLRKQIRRLALELHPDRTQDLPEAERRLRTEILSDATMLLKKLEEESIDIGQDRNSSIILVDDPHRELVASVDRLTDMIARVLGDKEQEPQVELEAESGEIDLDPIEFPEIEDRTSMPRMKVQPTAMTGRSVQVGYAPIPWERGVLIGAVMLGTAVWIERTAASLRGRRTR